MVKGGRRKKGGRIENRSAAWRSQHHRMSLLQLSREANPPSVPNFYAHSRNKTKLLRIMLVYWNAREVRTQERTSLEKMDCKKKLKSTCAPRWIALRAEGRQCRANFERLQTFLHSVHGASRQVRSGLFARCAFNGGASSVLVYGNPTAGKVFLGQKQRVNEPRFRSEKRRDEGKKLCGDADSSGFGRSCFVFAFCF